MKSLKIDEVSELTRDSQVSPIHKEVCRVIKG